MQYQERLKNWETREHKKQKELDREREKDRLKEIEREKEARRLKEFLEDYDDERDDPKYYKGGAFQRKLQEREQEKEVDMRDRAKEKEELEELRAKIISQGHDNPDMAFQRACEEREEQYRARPLVKHVERKHHAQSTSSGGVAIETVTVPDTEMDQPPPPEPMEQPDDQDDSDSDGNRSDGMPEPDMGMDNDDYDHSRDGMDDNGMDDDQPPSDQFFSSDAGNSAPPKRKKLDVKDVFNQEDDDMPQKKKKLPLPGKDKSVKDKAGGEEKRKHIKTMIDKIPTTKEELFAYPIDSSLVDAVLMEKRIRPWINKKIVEYIGEPEPTLVDFICSKVLVGSEPQSLLNDVQMVLDDEAEVFVVKMWRLLIYEIEAKRLGAEN